MELATTVSVTLPSTSAVVGLLVAGIGTVVAIAAAAALHPRAVNNVAAAWSMKKPIGWVVVLAMTFALGRSMVTAAAPPPTATTFSAPVSAPAEAPSTGGAPQGPTAPIVMAARPLFPDVPAGGYPHDVYTAGNCTWWAAYNRHVPAWAPDGDAWRWYGNAIRDGIPTSREPSVGAIVVYRATAANSWHGHVAIVVAIGVGALEVSEMNWLRRYVVDQRGDRWPNPEVEGFIPR